MGVLEEEIRDLVEQYGSPLYIFDRNGFADNYKLFVKTISSVYPKYRLAYSYKTNHTPRICKLVKELGGYAEVVSDMEYTAAKRLNYDNRMIIYNGPFKGKLAEEHLMSGGILNIDNLDEVKRVVEFAKRYKERQFKLGIRINSEIGQNFISRFGIDAESTDLSRAVVMLGEPGNIQLVGFHFHVGKARGCEEWLNRSKRLIELSDEFIGVPEYIDLGSGMFGDMEDCLSEQFSINIPTYSDYADVTARLFFERYGNLKQEEQPILFTEPGSTIINRYVSFVASVNSIKRIKGKYFAVLNCSKYNLGEICLNKNLPLCIINQNIGEEEYKQVDFVGYTCLENDIVYRGYSGPLSVGDFVIFGNVGGYSNVAKPPFILPNCPMIEICEDGATSVIKRNESFDDVFLTYMWN